MIKGGGTRAACQERLKQTKTAANLVWTFAISGSFLVLIDSQMFSDSYIFQKKGIIR